MGFNDAYSPWCAYSDGYVGPFVPPENRLHEPIRAGEKINTDHKNGSSENAT